MDVGSDDRIVLWARAARSDGRQRLDYDRIAEVGVGLADGRGLGAVTLRSVAAELDVTAMALYRYVADKTELITLMVDAAFLSTSRPRGRQWRTVMRWYAREQRRVVLEHPWLLEVPARARTGLSPNNAAMLERVLAALADVDGLGNDDAIVVVDTVAAYAQGTAMPEAVQRTLLAELDVATLEDVRAVTSTQVRWLMATGEYPHIAARLASRPGANDLERRFERGLDCVLDGVAARFGLDVGVSGR